MEVVRQMAAMAQSCRTLTLQKVGGGNGVSGGWVNGSTLARLKDRIAG
ncbi:TPA: hypothetical protein ACU8DA_002912 [Legionella pneumophila]